MLVGCADWSVHWTTGRIKDTNNLLTTSHPGDTGTGGQSGMPDGPSTPTCQKRAIVFVERFYFFLITANMDLNARFMLANYGNGSNKDFHSLPKRLPMTLPS